MQATVTETERSSAEWSEVLASLNALVVTYDGEIAALETDRDSLALAAALGDAQAAHRQKQLTTAITTKTGAQSSTKAAIKQAQQRLDAARAAESEAAGTVRTNQMREYAEEARYAAEQFDAHMSQVVAHGADFKSVIQKMLQIATNQESRTLDQLLRPGPYHRAAEAAGMRHILEFEAWRGLKAHCRPLEIEISSHLDRWLTPPAAQVTATTPGPQAPETEKQEEHVQPEDKQDTGPWTERLREKVKFHKQRGKH